MTDRRYGESQSKEEEEKVLEGQFPWDGLEGFIQNLSTELKCRKSEGRHMEEQGTEQDEPWVCRERRGLRQQHKPVWIELGKRHVLACKPETRHGHGLRGHHRPFPS